MLSIERATPADAGEILTLQRAAWLAEGRDHASFAIPPLTQTLAELQGEFAGHVVLVARDGHRVVGTVRAREQDGRWQIGRLGVVPDRAGEGIGSRLLASIEALAPAGVTELELFTGPNSTSNHAFYGRRGYAFVTAAPPAPPGSDVVPVLMRKPRPTEAVAPTDPPKTPADPVRVDHVGIAVPDLEAAIEFWTAHFGAVCTHTETNDDQRVREAMLTLGDGVTELQLLAPLSSESTIGRFLQRHGPGLQQVALTVADVEATARALRAGGLRVIYGEARPGTSGSRVNFVHPKDTGGVLVELVQPVR